MLTILSALATAAPLDDGGLTTAAPVDGAALAKLASGALGREVPEKFLCVARPELPEGFQPDIAVVGVKVKGRGCTRQGVAVGESWHASEAALPAALTSPWSGLDRGAREQLATAWTRDALLAFDQPLPDSLRAEVSGDAVTVTLDVLQRSDEPLVAEQLTGVFRFDGSGALTTEVTGRTTWTSSLVLKPNSAKGMSVQQAAEALESVGKLLQRCFYGAWNEDLALDRRTRLTWDVTGGRASGIVARQSTDPRLSQCYANALGQASFPADGFVDFDLGVRRVETPGG